MITDSAALEMFMLKHSKDKEMLKNNMKFLEPFFVAADSGEYILQPSSEIDMDEVARALTLATGTEVQQVIPVSLEHSFSKPEWMGEEVYRNRLSGSLNGSLHTSLKKGLRNYLRYGLQAHTRDELRDNLEVSLLDSLAMSLKNRLRGSLEFRQRNHLRDSLRDSLFFFLELTLKGDKEMERLKPLLLILLKTQPLGEKRGEKGTWLTLVT